MPEKILQILDEKKMFVSYGILVAAIAIALLAGRTMLQIEQLVPIIKEFYETKSELKSDVAVIKNNYTSLEQRVTRLER